LKNFISVILQAKTHQTTFINKQATTNKSLRVNTLKFTSHMLAECLQNTQNIKKNQYNINIGYFVHFTLG